ncbi:XrtB/PEP-CTERM-associated transcriptional regulator EpsA [Ramlibacter sp.]|uniref:XrtB/PEP-CTERM-associated transcriptional regulator EpsA n=1 Tax=Ramlibacter sp. TaxID=1917967 RepID=UPI002CB3D5AD|nr:XrtB/PEP-CTERM-associated transcriptional regulator EpsA [Ramlibacter sp.]HWI82317.1 XrtB/PEP-CTERM-associated transcriptional regulator EpsA [Ramlibacter sp.]
MNNITTPLPERDPSKFLQIAGQGAGVATHAELWRWLQGDVQQWLSHDAMLVGWGDFSSGDLHYDLVSSVPGLRSHNFTPACIAPFVGYLRDCWVAAQQAPCQVDITGCQQLLGHCNWASAQAIASMRTALVHGTTDGPRGGERIFAALSMQTSLPPGGGSALKLLLPFIDTALRRIPPAPVREAACDRQGVHTARVPALSERERQIMDWVALGKTNPEIGCILRISEFTVKNHMKSIFTKLDVTNRAQAVAKLNRMAAYA